jgi:hypothetical protein
MKVLRKNKRGAAMESAVLFMFVVLMLGMLLTGVAMLTHLRVKVNNTALTREIAIEQIGENFVHGTPEFKDLPDGDHTIDNYVAAITTNDDGTRILTLKTKNDKLLLHVEVPKNSTTPSVWKYTE